MMHHLVVRPCFQEWEPVAEHTANQISPDENDQEGSMGTTFRMDVERFKAELLKQVQPETGMVDLCLRTNSSEEAEMAAGEATAEIAVMLQRPIVLHFFDGEQRQGELFSSSRKRRIGRADHENAQVPGRMEGGL